jgi:alpha-beta hydrolase superfamily lysophospholipase
MSDSPYSLRRLGESLHAEGAHVIGLRLPGHGTAPAGLTSVDWRDMYAATVLAVDHLKATNPKAPLHLIGYSNGGGLAIHYAIQSLADEQLSTPDGIVLISPAIGVSPMARIAVWQGRLGNWIGLEKLAWNSIRPEYDPYKYNSFAVNAGHQVYQLTGEIDRDLAKMAGRQELDNFPPVVAFQSVVDATVSAPALIENLFSRLPERQDSPQHELVLFDINREPLVNNLIDGDPTSRVAEILHRGDHSFAITIFSNRDAPTKPPTTTRWQNGAASGPPETPAIPWPGGLYSLSHISLPFSPDDGLYGNQTASAGTADQPYRIGNLVLRGERGVLQIPASDQLRLRWNPFYPWLENRITEFVSWPTADN